MGFSPGGGGLSNISDVAFNNLTTNNVLTYDQSIAKWKNGSLDSMTVVADSTRFAGIHRYTALDSSALSAALDSSAGLTAAIEAVPDGGNLVIPNGDYVVMNAIPVLDKTITITCHGAKFIKSKESGNAVKDGAIFSFSQALEATQKVLFPTITTVSTTTSSDGTTTTSTPATEITLTLPAPDTWRRGEFIKIVADDYVTGTRSPKPETVDTPSPDGWIQARVGQIMEIREVKSSASPARTVIVLEGVLRLPFTTNIRAALIPNNSVKLYGGTFDVSDAIMNESLKANGATGSGLIVVKNLISPLIEGIRVLRQSGPNISFVNCLNPIARDNVIGFSVNDPSPADENAIRLGYGISIVNCHGGLSSGNQFFDVRHGFTDDVQRIPSKATDLSSYGWPYAHIFESNLIQGSTAAAISTHHGGDSHQFINNTILNCPDAYNMRGINHTIFGGRVREVDILFQTDSERGGVSYGHMFRNVFADGVNQVFRMVGSKVDNNGVAIRETVICEISDNRVRGIRQRIGGNSLVNIRFARNLFQLGATFTGTGFDSLVQIQNSRITWEDDVINTITSPLGGATALRPVFDFISNVSSECFGSIRLRNSSTTTQFDTIATRSGTSTGSQLILRATVSNGWGNGYADYIPTTLASTSSLWMEGEEDAFSNARVVVDPADIETNILGKKVALIRQPSILLRVGPTTQGYTFSSDGWGAYAVEPQRIVFFNTGTTNNLRIQSSNAKFSLSGDTDLSITPGKWVEFLATGGILKQITPLM